MTTAGILRRNKPLLVITCLVILIVLFSRPILADSNRIPKTQPAVQGFFDGLKGINLIVRVTPGQYETAVECHGRIEECVQRRYANSQSRSKEKVIEKEIESLETADELYPSALYPESLYKVLSKKMEEAHLRYIEPDENGEAAKFRMPLLEQAAANKSFIGKIEEAVTKPDFLTVTLGVEIFDKYETKTALLTLRYYRPGISSDRYEQALGISSALISLEDSPQEIQTAVDEFILNKNFSIIRNF